jgi:hypothetical protein
MAYTCNPSYSRDGDGDDHSWFEASPVKQLVTPSQANKKLSMIALACRPNYLGSINKRTEIQACLSIKVRLYFKNWLKQ